MTKAPYFGRFRIGNIFKPTPKKSANAIIEFEKLSVAQIYQIYYSDETARMLDPGFIPLDNTNSERPEWREYFPIRDFLLKEELNESVYYGFFAPKFFSKTNLDSSQVFSFIEKNTNADVVLFSPFCDEQALFLNCFLQGERSAPGLVRVTEKFLEKIGLSLDLRHIVMDSRTTVFCNYFVAKPAFWRAWLEINENLFYLSENRGDLYAPLNSPVNYNGVEIPIKVFIMERIASLLLSMNASFTATAYNPFSISISTNYPEHLETAVVCDALKLAYRVQGHDSYMVKYFRLLNEHSIPEVIC